MTAEIMILPIEEGCYKPVLLIRKIPIFVDGLIPKVAGEIFESTWNTRRSSEVCLGRLVGLAWVGNVIGIRSVALVTLRSDKVTYSAGRIR